MKQVSVAALKKQLSRYLRLVKHGEVIEILERSVPVARLEGVQGLPTRTDDYLERLRRDGIVLPAKRSSRTDLVNEPPVACRTDPAEAVIDQRADR